MPILTDIDKIRLEVGCTDLAATVTLHDDEITYLLTQERNFWGGAARCAEALARKYLLKADVRLGRSLTLTYTKTAEQYLEMAKDLRAKAQATVVPWVGGMSATDKESFEQATDLVQPAFARGMQQNPRVGGYTSDVGDTDGGGADADFD